MSSRFSAEVEAFIKRYVKDLEEGAAAVFAGAGLSRTCGFVNWKELLREIAEELELSVEFEHDLISVAQYHVNKKNSPTGLSRKILEEFSEQAEPSEAHRILARLPIRTYWTTNYDTLIEDSLKENYRVADVKRKVDDLILTRPKRDAVVYKMHGDVDSPGAAVLYKAQYEQYYKTHEGFITALSGDLISKTFLFIGFSFTDPNLDYILSRLHVPDHHRRTHYCFLRKEPATKQHNEDEAGAMYRQRRQEHHIRDLLRFGIEAVLVEEYDDIPVILKEIESRFRKKTIFISGSAEEYGDWDKQVALSFVHTLSASLVKAGYRVVNGFGWGIGSAVINGALDAIYSRPDKYSEEQLVMRPFPQHPSNGKELAELWSEYRHRMIGLSGIALFLFGNKLNEEDEVINAGGVRKEFEIAQGTGVAVLPIGVTGYMAKELAEEMLREPEKNFTHYPWLEKEVAKLLDPAIDRTKINQDILSILKKLGG
ncbi:SIR2 family protein [Aeromonas hydrophila]|uniref:SIR2 family protein n=1 Tax=Aeromonas TaxID=642 RepID=UPI0022E7A0F3|nr:MULTISPECIES: SIR2 family protein [unclassified Aeromonas]MDD9306149.1 SIR2 family protein [Aeromonas hydrophila]